MPYDPCLGEIRIWAPNFAPRGWAFCNGQLIAISQNPALYSLLGSLYGGDGIQTFGLPDLRGRVVVGAGQGPGLSNYILGQSGGVESIPVTSAMAAAGSDVTAVEAPPSGELENRQPYLGLNYIIALQGLYPQRQ